MKAIGTRARSMAGAFTLWKQVPTFFGGLTQLGQPNTRGGRQPDACGCRLQEWGGGEGQREQSLCIAAAGFALACQAGSMHMVVTACCPSAPGAS